MKVLKWWLYKDVFENKWVSQLLAHKLVIHIAFMLLSREISRAAGKMATGTYDETLENDAK